MSATAGRSATVALPDEFEPRRLRRRAAQVSAVIAVIILVALLAPGLRDVRDRLGEARPGWLALAVALEALSCLSYVLMFRPIFCPQMSKRTARELALSELGVGAIVPASGAAGLALGAWVLQRAGWRASRLRGGRSRSSSSRAR